jgi:hypothetical protein
MKRKRIEQSYILSEYLEIRKHYCIKCKFYYNGKCMKKRIVKDCVKEGKRNV